MSINSNRNNYRSRDVKHENPSHEEYEYHTMNNFYTRHPHEHDENAYARPHQSMYPNKYMNVYAAPFIPHPSANYNGHWQNYVHVLPTNNIPTNIPTSNTHAAPTQQLPVNQVQFAQPIISQQ